MSPLYCDMYLQRGGVHISVATPLSLLLSFSLFFPFSSLITDNFGIVVSVVVVSFGVPGFLFCLRHENGTVRLSLDLHQRQRKFPNRENRDFASQCDK